MKSGKPSQNGKEEVRKAQKHKKLTKLKTPPESTPHNTLNAISPPYIDIYHVFSLNHPISKSLTIFVPILSHFGNELIKHKMREERDAMQEIKIRVLYKAYKQVFK
jgi:hypothetical protein